MLMKINIIIVVIAERPINYHGYIALYRIPIYTLVESGKSELMYNCYKRTLMLG